MEKQQGNVLVVDDDPGVRAVLAQLITRDGFIVYPASGLDAAVKALQTVQFVAVVLDLHLPDADGQQRSGLELLSFMRLHDHLKHIPVMILTGTASTDEEELAIVDLRAYLVQKPEGWRTVRHYLQYMTVPSLPQPKPN